MDTLRWILLVFGLILLAGIYFAGRRKQPDTLRRIEPGLNDSGVRNDGESEWEEEAEEFETEGDDRNALDAEEDSFDFERLLADERDPAPVPAKTQNSG